jgi:glycosyltransferase involved in cell wall biosynthesis
MKDHQAFLAAARIAAKERPDLVFVLAGTGTEPGSTIAVQAAALGLGDRVRLLGRRSDIPALFAAFDLVTLSSANGEGFSNVLGEAMACGTPCVATDVGDASIILGDSGVIVPPRSPEALAQAWLRMIALGPEKRRAIGHAARQRIVARYGIDAIGRRYARMYRRLVALRVRT